MTQTIDPDTGAVRTGSKDMAQDKHDRRGVFPQDRFETRHIGPDERETAHMLSTLGYATLDALTDAAVPPAIRMKRALATPAARSERDALADVSALAAQNQVWRSYLGLGYHDCVTPPVVQRNI